MTGRHLPERSHPGAFDAGSDDREHFAVRRTVLQSTSVRQDGFDFCTIASRASRMQNVSFDSPAVL
ncbi:MAG: hypothetical protein DMF95_09525 [Acidobacteria bacterium]|nr:MAG: hypothetical protein DMF95_09525 [Acidobacteriota bacterium]